MKIKIWNAKDGWRWHAKASNGRIVAESGEAYSRRRDLLRALINIGLAAAKIADKEKVDA